MKIKKAAVPVVALAIIVATAAFSTQAFAADAATAATSTSAGTSAAAGHGRFRGGLGGPHGNAHRPIVMGTISAISGSSITVAGRAGKDGAAATSHVVDASAAKIMKDKGVAATLADLKVGDMIAVEGTTSGTSVTATTIFSGTPFAGKLAGGAMGRGKGRGMPAVSGTVSSVSGTSITLAAKNGTAYTVDASAAKIMKGKGTAATAADVQAGDAIAVFGTSTGTSISATMIFDGKLMAR